MERANAPAIENRGIIGYDGPVNGVPSPDRRGHSAWVLRRPGRSRHYIDRAGRFQSYEHEKHAVEPEEKHRFVWLQRFVRAQN